MFPSPEYELNTDLVYNFYGLVLSCNCPQVDRFESQR